MDGHAPRQLCDAVYPGRTSHTCLQSPDIDPQGLPCSIELQYSVLIYPLTLFELRKADLPVVYTFELGHDMLPVHNDVDTNSKYLTAHLTFQILVTTCGDLPTIKSPTESRPF